MTCNNCGWVHFGVTKEYAKAQSQWFHEWLKAQPEATRENYGGLKEVSTYYNDYLKCSRCGESYKNFRETQVGDCPDGCTIGPIIDFREPLEGGISL